MFIINISRYKTEHNSLNTVRTVLVTAVNVMFAAYGCVKFYSQVVFRLISKNILKFFGVVDCLTVIHVRGAILV